MEKILQSFSPMLSITSLPYAWLYAAGGTDVSSRASAIDGQVQASF